MPQQPSKSLSVPPLPGGIGLTHLKVYDTVTPDGLVGGSPHVHLACTEAYFITVGHGTVQVLDSEGFREIPLEPGALLWFTPGVIHRLINGDGRLEIVIPMENAGLPEAGDFVLTFPSDVLDDPEQYATAAALASPGHVHASSREGAMRRRDLAVEGFAQLRAEFEREGAEALRHFYQRAVRLVSPKVDQWRELWEFGPAAAVAESDRRLTAIAEGRVDHLLEGRLSRIPAAPVPWKLGVCGTLGVYQPEGVVK